MMKLQKKQNKKSIEALKEKAKVSPKIITKKIRVPKIITKTIVKRGGHYCRSYNLQSWEQCFV